MEKDTSCPNVGTVSDSDKTEKDQVSNDDAACPTCVTDSVIIISSESVCTSASGSDKVESKSQIENVELSTSNTEEKLASLQAMKEAALKLLDQVASDIHVTSEVSEDHEVLTESLLNSDNNSVVGNASLPSDNGCVIHISNNTNEQNSHKSQNVDSIGDHVHIQNVESSLESESPQIEAFSSESGQKHTQPSVEPGLNISKQYQYVAVPFSSTSVNQLADLFTTVEPDPDIHDEGPVAKKQKLTTITDTVEEIKNPNSEDVNTVTDTPEFSIISERPCVYKFNDSPRQLTGAWKSFDDIYQKNYLRGCKWAPDGTCILTNSNDNLLKIFNLPEELYYNGGENKIIPEMKPVVEMKEADTIYDFCWFPLMSSTQPDTACLCVTSKDTPVHLYDAFTGELRCSYRAYNHLDEVVAAHCINFNLDGSKLFCGFNKMIRIFDVTRPGRDFINRPTFAKEGQRGIISCIDHSPTELGLYAAGSYSRTIALYNEPDGSMICMFEGQQGGVTQVKFSPDGTKLYSGGRRDNEIICWDMRNPGHILFTLQRCVSTNQRIYFDITSNGRYIISGSNDGIVRIWDTTISPIQHNIHLDPTIQPTMTFQAHKDTVNSVSLHPTLPILATGSGQRHFKTITDYDDESLDKTDKLSNIDNSLRLWWT